MQNKIVQNAILFAAFGILQKSIGVLLLPLYTRYLSPAEYGIIGMTTSLSLPLGIFFNFGLNTAVVRFHFHEDNSGFEFEKRLYSTLFVAISAITLLTTAAILIVSKPVIAPRATVKVTPASAVTAPKRLLRPSTAMASSFTRGS